MTKYLHSLVFLFLFLSISHAECSEILTINANLVSKISITQTSQFNQFPVYREDDMLFIQNLSITNTGSCDLKNIQVYVTMIKPSGKESQYILSPYTVDNVLLPNQTYFFQPHMDWQKETGVISYAEVMDEVGTYHLGVSVKANGMPISYSFIIGNRVLWQHPLYIKSITELAALETSQKALKEAEFSNRLAFAAILLAFSIEVFFRLFFDASPTFKKELTRVIEPSMAKLFRHKKKK